MSPLGQKRTLACTLPLRFRCDEPALGFHQRRQIVSENPIHTARPFPVKQITRRQESRSGFLSSLVKLRDQGIGHEQVMAGHATESAFHGNSCEGFQVNVSNHNPRFLRHRGIWPSQFRLQNEQVKVPDGFQFGKLALKDRGLIRAQSRFYFQHEMQILKS